MNTVYPPKYHLETDEEKIFHVIERFPLAILISSSNDEIQTTQIPLVLDRGSKTLLGHIDKNNPHGKLLDNRKVSLVFNGPNAYISPTTYAVSELPTWNYISVHASGTVTTIHDFDKVSDSIIAMAEFLETEDSNYQLAKGDEKLKALVPYVTGFEIEIDEMIGRYKLSQDKSAQDTGLARQHLINANKHDHTALLDYLLDTQ
ncbi:MAG: FMN-binding negative transcriptional regulator [Gammaproteobacteria bacterium]|nr:FMN-binding negative transcriptional regulator [Gammaproteobacteria bacterium]NNC97090.1 FMN-binding negative transcriptional regulator [Gammaproteobacteria bacterium]NNM14077.1 FMN-binding negative transcriptional regulator [Gammaproteobacteria bacterium]